MSLARLVTLPLQCLLLLLAPISHTAAQEPAVTLHISAIADPSGFVDEMSKERQKAVVEITKRLEKQKGVRIVQTPEQAQVTFEITSAAIVRVGERKTVTGVLFGPPPGSGNPNATVPEIRGTLRAGDYSVEMVGSSQLRWKQCWNELTSQLKTWLKDNRAKLRPSSR